MAEWIQIDTNIKNNPKIRDLGDILGISTVYAVGHMVSLWIYAFNHFKSGLIQGRNLEHKISVEGAEWPGDPKQFVDAAVEVRLLHRTHDGAVCEKCFPRNEDGTPRALEAGMYWLHDWEERIKNWLYFEEKKRIIREQNAERWRKKRMKDTHGMVREIPAEYEPKRRGLRAAPATVKKLFHHALESVTSREILRDVTQTSRFTSQTEGSVEPSKTPKSGSNFEAPKTTNSNVELTNVDDNQSDNEKRDVTQTSRSASRLKKRDVTQTSRQYIHTDVLPSSKGNYHYKYNLSPKEFSLKDRERKNSLGGAESEKTSAPALGFSNLKAEESSDPHPQTVIDFWHDKYLAEVGEKCPEDMGRLARAAATWRRRGYLNGEIIRRIESFFSGYHENSSIGEFQKRFVVLKNGPLTEYTKNVPRRKANGEDFRNFNPERDRDFGKPDNL